MEVLQDVGIRNGSSAMEIIETIKNTIAESLDTNPKLLKQKKTRLVKLLQSLENLIVIVPFNNVWILAKCKRDPILKCVPNFHYIVSNTHEKKLVRLNNLMENGSTQKLEPFFALGLEIEAFHMMAKPFGVRLPPISIQEIKDHAVMKLIYNEFNRITH